MPFKAIAGLAKIIPQLFKLLPVLLKGFMFLFVGLPKMVFAQIKNAMNFIKKSIPIAFAVILSYMLVFFGLQMLITNVLGTPGLIPHPPLAVFSLLIVYELVMTQGDLMKKFQKFLLKAFLFIFANPLTKELFNFNVKIDPKNPLKSMPKILAWAAKNMVKIILTIFFLIFLTKISAEKIWGYITFYMEG
jgi:hypothetical protein